MFSLTTFSWKRKPEQISVHWRRGLGASNVGRIIPIILTVYSYSLTHSFIREHLDEWLKRSVLGHIMHVCVCKIFWRKMLERMFIFSITNVCSKSRCDLGSVLGKGASSWTLVLVQVSQLFWGGKLGKLKGKGKTKRGASECVVSGASFQPQSVLIGSSGMWTVTLWKERGVGVLASFLYWLWEVLGRWL